MGTEIETELDKYLAWLNDMQELGTILATIAYSIKASEAYNKLPEKTKEKIEFRSFAIGYIISSLDFSDSKKKEEVKTTPPVSSPTLKSGVSTGAN